MRKLLVLILCSPLLGQSVDVVVYGATPAGIMAAIAARRENRSVVLLEPGQRIGGMITGGLGATDVVNTATIGGLSREFFTGVYNAYITAYGASSPQVKDCAGGFRFEPHVASQILQRMLDTAGISPSFGERSSGINKTGAVITSLSTESGKTYTAKVFIDATYEGDLMALAGVSFALGREGGSEFGESLAGVYTQGGNQWPLPISGLDANANLLPEIQASALDPLGTGDAKLQAYNFRLCLTQTRPVPWPRPLGYDATRYELLRRFLAAKPGLQLKDLVRLNLLPNGKVDANSSGPMSTDHIGSSWAYPEASESQRGLIWQDHRAYIQGFFYFLAQDLAVPSALQAEVNSWGLAPDEFLDTGSWPSQLYVREARRLRGACVLKQADLQSSPDKPDAVAVGSYPIDSHHVERVLLADGSVCNEGDLSVAVKPYAIPYGILTPRTPECSNLLVPVAASATHVAYGSLRVEPTFMMLGQAAGLAASLAVLRGQPVQDIDVSLLRSKLASTGIILSPEQAVRPAAVDDAAAAKVGAWTASAALPGFIGPGYLHDGNTGKGLKSVTFQGHLAAAGNYDVLFYYTACANRATNVPVTVSGHLVTVNERALPPLGQAINLGTFALPANPVVVIQNAGTNGYVVVDAVQFIQS